MGGSLSGLSKYSMQTLSLRDAIITFDENLSEIRAACLSNAQDVIARNSPYLELTDEEDMTPENILLHLNHLQIQQHGKPLLETVKRIDSYRLHKNTEHSPGFITDDDIAAAKEVGPEWFVYEASLNHKNVGKCPFHADNKPSLTLMRSKRTGHYYLKCFPCSKSWNSISFIMERDNLPFIEAVKVVTNK